MYVRYLLSLLTGKLRKQEGIVFTAVADAYLTIDKINAIADSLQLLDLNPDANPEPNFYKKNKL